MNRDLIDYKNFYVGFGISKEEVVNSALTYRGWAKYGTTDDSAGWIIERESVQAGITVVETARNEGGTYDTLIWDNRATYFSDPPFANYQSMQFDGVDMYGTFGDKFNYERTQPWTWGFWYKPRVLASHTFYHRRNSNVGIRLRALSNARLYLEITNTVTTNSLVVQSPTNGYLANTWYHMVFVYDGSSTAAGVALYINGTAQTKTNTADTLSSSVLTNGATAYMGSQSGAAEFIDGHLDEISHWNIALSAAQVQAIYNGGHPLDVEAYAADNGLTANHKLYLRMGEGNNFPVIPDETGNSNDLTIVNGLSSNVVSEVP